MMQRKEIYFLLVTQLLFIFISMMVMRLLVNSIIENFLSYGDLTHYQIAIHNLDYRRGLIFLMFPTFFLIVPIIGYLSEKLGKLNLIIFCNLLLLFTTLTAYCGEQLQSVAINLFSLFLFCIGQSSIPITLSIFINNLAGRKGEKLFIIFVILQLLTVGIIGECSTLINHFHIPANFILISSFIIELIVCFVFVSKSVMAVTEKHNFRSLGTIGEMLYQILTKNSLRNLFIMLFLYKFICNVYEQSVDKHINLYNTNILMNYYHILMCAKILVLGILLYCLNKVRYKKLINIFLPLSVLLIFIYFASSNLHEVKSINILTISLAFLVSLLLWLRIIKTTQIYPTGFIIALVTSLWIAAHMLANLFVTALSEKHENLMRLIVFTFMILIGILYKYSALRQKINKTKTDLRSL